jgi:radical S-adenosyl methionine domain-containing protein 2
MNTTFAKYGMVMGLHTSPFNVALPGTINLFVNSRCNFHCKHCYATFQDIPGANQPALSETDAKAIIRLIAEEPLPDNTIARKITFVGGEPTLCPFLPQLVGYSKSLGLVTAVITNGTIATPRYLEQFSRILDWVGLSIDGLDQTMNRSIGRATLAGRYLDEADYLERIASIRAIGAQVKINTVVSALNWRSDFTQFITAARPVRWKALQVTPVAGQNDGTIKLLEIDRSKFNAFVDRHRPLTDSGIIVVAEPVETIRGSYAMISPDGRFFDSSEGRHHYSDCILDVGLSNAFNEVAFDEGKYDGRDGNYDPFTGKSHSSSEALVNN